MTAEVILLRETTLPFSSAEKAWLAAMRWLATRQQGEQTPEWVDGCVAALDRLWRQHRIELAHARTLRIHGQAGKAPRGNTEDARLWQEATQRLEFPLRVKGIVGEPGQ